MLFPTEDADEVPVVKQEGFEIDIHVLLGRMLLRPKSLGTEAEHVCLVGDGVAMRFLGWA